MKLGIVAICITALLLCMGCKKEPKNCDCPTNGNVCTDLPLPSLGAYNTGYVFTYDTAYVTYPCFNPNNGNEIIFYKSNQLIKFNLQTHQQQVIFSQPIIGQPQWGRNGWIIFSMGQIYEINSNGDSLKQLTFGSNSDNYNPKWNFAGDKFITEYVGSTYSYNIYDANGNLLDTITSTFAGVYSWQNPNNLMLVGYIDNAILTLNPQTNSISTIVPANPSVAGAGPVMWFPDGINFLYGNNCGLNKINYVTGSNICLQSKCQNDVYMYVDVSSLSQKIICEVDHWKSLGGASILISSKLVLMNLDATGQQVIPVN